MLYERLGFYMAFRNKQGCACGLFWNRLLACNITSIYVHGGGKMDKTIVNV